MWAGQDVSKEEERVDEEECPQLKKLHCKKHDVLTDELDPHTFSVLILDGLAELSPTADYPFFPRGS